MNACAAFCISFIYAGGLSAGLIVNGDISSNALIKAEDASSYTLQSGDLNAGWVSSNSVNFSLNADAAASVPNPKTASIQYASSSGNPGGFYLAEKTESNFVATTWNLFTLSGTVNELSIDIAVLDSFVSNDSSVIAIPDAAVVNSSNLSFVLYGISGDLATALSTPIGIDGNILNAPNGAGGFTTLLAPTAMSTVSSLNTWETQTFSITGSYAYYLFGMANNGGVSGNGVQGVGIDNVSISTSPIPEPSIYISGLGFIFLGCFLYHRRKVSLRTVESVNR
ncbi:hypothetical protein [Cerasicoccus arenae]|nr:hypothetical protein [Cerasicoccus arenae]MBK1859784.1 hypothetical protein [Cerasicoccus arenae]